MKGATRRPYMKKEDKILTAQRLVEAGLPEGGRPHDQYCAAVVKELARGGTYREIVSRVWERSGVVFPGRSSQAEWIVYNALRHFKAS